jgi:hypothetical protein
MTDLGLLAVALGGGVVTVAVTGLIDWVFRARNGREESAARMG